MTNFKVTDFFLDAITCRYEGLHDGDLTQIGLQPKMDCSGNWTEGYGSLMYFNGLPLKGAENKALAYANATIHNHNAAVAALRDKFDTIEHFVNELSLQLNQRKFEALCDFAYNCGQGALLQSSLLKLVKNCPNSSATVQIDTIADMAIRNELEKLKYTSINEIKLAFVRYCKGTSETKKGLILLHGLLARRISEGDWYLG